MDYQHHQEGENCDLHHQHTLSLYQLCLYTRDNQQNNADPKCSQGGSKNSSEPSVA